MSIAESLSGDDAGGPAGESPRRRAASGQPDNIDFSGLLAAFRRRMWTFLITFGLTVAAVVLFLILYPPDYTATARVTINQRTITATPNKEAPVVSQLPLATNDVDTEAQVIQSRRVAQRVIQKLNLDNDPEFSSNHVGWKQNLTDFFVRVSHPVKVISPQDKVIDAVLGGLDPERYLQTNAIDINYKDKNPAKAQVMANAFAEAYLEDQLASKQLQDRQASNALMSELESMRRQASADSDKVQAYKIAHNLLSVGAQTLTEQEISGDDQAVAAARAEAAADQANLRTAQDQLTRGSNGGDVGAALSSPTVSTLRAQRATLTGKLADLEGHYGPKYPDLAQARRAVANIDLEIEAEILREVSNLSAKANISQKRLASLEGTVSASKRTLAENNAAQGGLEDLVRAATVSQTIYEAYLERFKESAAQLASLTPDADIVSLAGLPTNPSLPVAWLFLLLAIVAGVLFGSAAVLLAELLDDRLNTPADVERKLGLPYLGGIPLLSSVMPGATALPLDVIISKPRSPFSEAMRSLLASVRLRDPAGGLGVVVVTSPGPREGKTTVAAGLARTSALQGVSTVLVDCDARGRGRGLMRDLKIKHWGPGLIEVLKGEAPLAEALRVDEASGAVLLPMSDNPQPSDDVMGGEAMDALLATLRRQYAAVILDAPALPIAISRILAAEADSTIIVADWRGKADGGVLTAIRLPPFDQASRVGVALNRIDVMRQARYGLGEPASFDKKFSNQYA
jgi:succinoglycan biosynthesis transport protein ExoP